jgi:hypothetical protein
VDEGEPARQLVKDLVEDGVLPFLRRLLNGTHGTKIRAGPSPATVKARLTPSEPLA